MKTEKQNEDMTKNAEVAQMMRDGMTFEEIQQWFTAVDDCAGIIALSRACAYPTIESMKRNTAV